MSGKSKWPGLMFRGGFSLCLLLAWGWGFFAIFFAYPGPDWLRITLASLFGCCLPGILFFSRSFIKGVGVCLVLFSILIWWWQSLQPTGDKEWAADVAKVAHGEIKDDVLTMHNVRNFRYTDEDVFEEHWETREYNLDEIQGLDLFLSYWASEHIAHAIISWDFGQDQHLAISIETRKDIHQEYSAVKGFFKQFELIYVAADEKDIIRLRTNFRKERVYAYHLNISQKRVRALLESYIVEMNRLASTPEFYDALTRNCTTAIHLHAKALNPDDPLPLDWRIIASGHLDEYLYERGVVSRSLPFTKFRQQSRIDQKMQIRNEEDFSRLLRKDLP